MKRVRAKKHLGQHFLKDNQIAFQTVEAFNVEGKFKNALEVGPGMGVLTDLLIQRKDFKLYLVEIDGESVEYLKNKNEVPHENIIEGDFLELDFQLLFQEKPLGVI